jgi:hypothetical protein
MILVKGRLRPADEHIRGQPGRAHEFSCHAARGRSPGCARLCWCGPAARRTQDRVSACRASLQAAPSSSCLAGRDGSSGFARSGEERLAKECELYEQQLGRPRFRRAGSRRLLDVDNVCTKRADVGQKNVSRVARAQKKCVRGSHEGAEQPR